MTSVILCELHHFTNWFNSVLYVWVKVIYVVIHKCVWMTLLILIIFLVRERILLLPCYLVRKTYEVNKSTHTVSLIMVISLAFHSIIFWYFDINKAHQLVHGMAQLPRFDRYSMYIGFQVFYMWYLILCCFTKLSKVNPGPCTRSFSLSNWRVTQTVCIIWSCAFQRGPFQGWSARCLLLP